MLWMPQSPSVDVIEQSCGRMPTVTRAPTGTPVTAVSKRPAFEPISTRTRPSCTRATPGNTLICGSPTNPATNRFARSSNPGVHHREPVGQRQRIHLVVRNDDGGVAKRALQHFQISRDSPLPLPSTPEYLGITQRVQASKRDHTAPSKAGPASSTI
jgi:hypothetical protein